MSEQNLSDICSRGFQQNLFFLETFLKAVVRRRRRGDGGIKRVYSNLTNRIDRHKERGRKRLSECERDRESQRDKE